MTGEPVPAAVDDSVATPAPAEAAPKKRWLDPRLRKVLGVIISIVVVVAIFWFVFRQFADLSSVWAAMKTLTWREIAWLAVATLWNLVTYWLVVVIATPGLTLPQAGVLTQSTTAVANTVPAGGAIAVGLTYTMLSSWGFSKSRGTLSILITGIWNNFVKLGTPILALALLILQGQPGGGRIVGAVIGLVALFAAIVIFAMILAKESFAIKFGLIAERLASKILRLFKRPPATGWDLAVTKFRSRVIGLVERRWLPLTAATVVSHLSLYAVLLVCLRVMSVSDAEVGWAEALAVFAFARLVTAIPITPGGAGVVELALITGLTAAGGEDAQVVAAVLFFRVLTFVLPILIGAGTYIFWRQNRSWRDSAPPLPAWVTAETSASG
jgi:putative heme transporter